ncbi:MAG: hypothetical protein JW776_13140 [Candidatus Lokiarchaeota archaeon]|nr:hypothetical protein [Candidatus Lokiarchaeota archaeon]
MLLINQFKSQILIFEVYKKFSAGYEDLYLWTRASASKSRFTIDVLKAKELARKDGIFYHIEHQDRKLCFFLFEKMLYLVGSENDVQFQLLEAIIEETSQEFFAFYKNKLEHYEGGFISDYKDFDNRFLYIIGDLKHIVTVVIAPCAVCGKSIGIIAKNSLINRFPEQRIPVPLVFTHQGHSLLIYLDKQFNVRGSEIVDISS